MRLSPESSIQHYFNTDAEAHNPAHPCRFTTRNLEPLMPFADARTGEHGCVLAVAKARKSCPSWGLTQHGKVGEMYDVYGPGATSLQKRHPHKPGGA